MYCLDELLIEEHLLIKKNKVQRTTRANHLIGQTPTLDIRIKQQPILSLTLHSVVFHAFNNPQLL